MKSITNMTRIIALLVFVTIGFSYAGQSHAQTPDCQGAQFFEDDTVVIIDAESVAPTDTDRWEFRNWTSVDDPTAPDSFVGDEEPYAGTGYYEWTGDNYFNDTPNEGLLEYTIYISTPGKYRLSMRSVISTGDLEPPDGKGGTEGIPVNKGSEHNDIWMTFPDAARMYGERTDSEGNVISTVYPRENTYGPGGTELVGNTLTGGSADGFFKVRQSTVGDFSWSAATNDSSAHAVFVDFDAPGVYTWQLKPRSKGFGIDRISLYEVTDNQISRARNFLEPETVCEGDLAPTITRFEPELGENAAEPDTDIVFEFSEPVTALTGDIVIFESGSNTEIERFDVNDPRVGMGQTTMTVNPINTFAYGTSYYVNIDAGTFEDADGTDFTGLSGTTWTFTVKSAPSAQSAKILPPADDLNGEYRFGWSVAQDSANNRAIFGAYGENVEQESNVGTAFIYGESNGDWTAQQKLLAPDGMAEDEFGWTVDIDGNTAVVGAWGDPDEGAETPGAVYIYELTGQTWVYKQTLVPSGSENDDLFGFDMQLTGSTLLVGAPGFGTGQNDASGAAYVFTLINGTWVETQALVPGDVFLFKGFGTSVAFDGNYMLIGAPGDSFGRGAVYPYVFNGTWQPGIKFSSSDGEGTNFGDFLGDFFGTDVALDGGTAVIGAWQDRGGPSEGSAYIFTTADGATWVQGQKLLPDATLEDGFGFSVQIVGDLILVSADDDGIETNPLTGTPYPDGAGDESGVLYQFRDVNGFWFQTHKLVSGDNDAGDFFGMQFDTDGTTALVGAWGDDEAGSDAGAVYPIALDLNIPFAPEIAITASTNVDIASGDTTPSFEDTTDFGSIDITLGGIPNVYTITNTGNAPLTITSITTTGTNAAEFVVTSNIAAPIQPNTTAQFTVTFDPAEIGTRTATVEIVNDDEDENPFTFAVQGQGLVADINVKGNGQDIPNGDTTPDAADGTDFGEVDINSGALQRLFVIENLDTAGLIVDSVTVTGANAADFAIAFDPMNPIAAFGAQNFVVTFNPSAMGTRTATVEITSNDPDESPYTFAVQGEGVVGGELVTDGGFDNDLNDWVPFNVDASVTDGVVSMTRIDSGDNGILAQQLNASNIAANTKFETNLQLGNNSNQPKYVTLALWEFENLNSVAFCFFTIPANTPLQTYTMQSVTNAQWARADLWLFVDDFNDPALLVDNVSVRETVADVTTTNCDAPLVEGGNMVINGDFAANEAFYFQSPAVNSSVNNGVFRMTRGTLFDSFNNPMMAILAQNTRFTPPAGTPIEASVKLGNTSNEAKLVSLHVMEFPTEATRQFCVFVVPPNTSMQTYTLQTVTAADWSNTDLQLFLEDFGEQWLEVDDMSLSYEPNKGITELTCSTPLVEDRNLLLNGDFDYGNIFFGTFGTLATQQVQNSGGFFLEMTTNTVGFDLGALFQPIFFDAPANTPFEVSLILANPTVEAKNVAIRLWDFPNETDQIFCFFQLPANSAPQLYTMQGVSQSEWTNIGFELFLDDGLPSLQVDDISVQALPNAGITELSCPAVAIPAGVEPLAQAAQAPELEVAPAEVEVESVTLDVAPVAPEVAAPEVTEEAPAPVVEEPAAPIVTEEAPAPTAEEPVVEEPAVEAAPAEAETDPVIEEAAPVEEAVPAETEPTDATE